jgi:hypothetical protein
MHGQNHITLGMQSETNTMKNGEPTVDCLIFMKILQHTIGFGQGFLSKEQCDNNGPSLILS